MTVQVSVQGRKNCENYCTYAWDRTIGHTPVTNHCSYLHLQYMNSIQGGNNFFVNFSFMCPILTGFLPQRNGGCAVLLPMPVQHTEKLMFFEATNETAVKAFFFSSWSIAWEVLFISTWTLEICSSHRFLQQPPSLLPIPCGLYSAVHD